MVAQLHSLRLLFPQLEAQKSRANSGPGATEILNEAEERRKRLLARQRHTFEKEMVSLQREIEELQQQLDARDS
ncbi:hypothetical protein DL93DRAFT_2079902 [Clavulina sp. PMI_390]|nr:hypothetical protein DL93DRAFT_2079902 [Clavulina sp. PMI_390]